MAKRRTKSPGQRRGALPGHWWHGYREFPEHDPDRPRPKPGTRVRLTGQFLRNTGQMAGGEGGKVWVVQECSCGLCQSGRFVSVDEPAWVDPGEDYRLRHIAHLNLEDVDRLERLEREGRASSLTRQRE
jgi:hypothetical protein